jgi:hypothetical protein
MRMTKSRRVRWARHVARMGEKRNTYKILPASLKRRRHSEHLNVDEVKKLNFYREVGMEGVD